MSADGGRYIDGNDFKYAPGDTLALPSYQNPYTYFTLANFFGTVQKPVIITNVYGQVRFINGLGFINCRNIKLTGTGSKDKYGFRIEDPVHNGVGIEITGRSSNIEVCNVFIYNKTYGFWVKQEANCADSLQYPHWNIHDIHIHHCYIRKVTQEAMYLGSSDPNGTRPVSCNGKKLFRQFLLRLGNMLIHDNIIDSTGRGGIQLSGADSGNNEIYNNIIFNCGFEFNNYQGNGIVLGGYSHAYIHHNVISRTFAAGIFHWAQDI